MSSVRYGQEDIPTTVSQEQIVPSAPQFTFLVNPVKQPPIHSNTFVFKPPNDFNNYNTECEKVSDDYVTELLNELYSSGSEARNVYHLNENIHVFFYRQQYDNQYFKITCEIVSPILINRYLNKNLHGIDFEQNEELEQLAFTLDQKKYLEFHLTKRLNNYLLA